MKLLVDGLETLGGMGQLVAQIFEESVKKPIQYRLVSTQIYQIGVQSLPLVMVVAGATGMVMALQFGFGLAKFGGKLYIPKIVSLSIVRELGPVFACLMVASRVGAGITSEIGSMKVTQQIDAIRALGTSPISKIVIPRVLGSLIAVPLLSVMATALGVLGGLFVGSSELGLDPWFYWEKAIATVKVADYFSGFGKTIFFALFVSITACYFGLTARGGTQGVGSATTKSVVTSAIFIVIGDFFLTKVFLVIEQWLQSV